MTFCLVYEEVQISLINNLECDAVANQILWNVIVLVQGIQFIENREKFSPKDDRVTGNRISGLIYPLGITGIGVNDFQFA
jgi:hypothetical protein